MHYAFIKMGRVQIVLVITVLSVAISVLFKMLAADFFNQDLDTVSFLVTVLPPLIIAPIMSWYLIGMLIRVAKMEQEMRELATYDSLTTLYTRRAFMELAEQLFKLSKREYQSFKVIYIDIDDFKSINDIHGHSAGDKVLKAFGSILCMSLRESDISGRIGGEEFAIVLSNVELFEALHIANNIRELVVNSSVQLNEKDISYTISLGIAELDVRQEITFEDILNRADNALYTSKKNGKNCVSVYID